MVQLKENRRPDPLSSGLFARAYRLVMVGAFLTPTLWLVHCSPATSTKHKVPGGSCPRGADYEYVHEDLRLCGALPACSRGVPFRNDCGCGCHVEASAVGAGYTVCGDVQRSVKYCKEEYAPVCGWFTATPDLCAGRYCRETYANSCFACKDGRVRVFSPSNCSI